MSTQNGNPYLLPGLLLIAAIAAGVGLLSMLSGRMAPRVVQQTATRLVPVVETRRERMEVETEDGRKVMAWVAVPGTRTESVTETNDVTVEPSEAEQRRLGMVSVLVALLTLFAVILGLELLSHAGAKTEPPPFLAKLFIDVVGVLVTLLGTASVIPSDPRRSSLNRPPSNHPASPDPLRPPAAPGSGFWRSCTPELDPDQPREGFGVNAPEPPPHAR